MNASFLRSLENSSRAVFLTILTPRGHKSMREDLFWLSQLGRGCYWRLVGSDQECCFILQYGTGASTPCQKQ